MEYSFTIVAVVGSTESAASDAVTATPIPPAVSDLSAAAGIAQVALSWTASTKTEVTGYKIRQTVEGMETEIDVTGRTTASHTVTDLAAGKSHTFTIAAVAGSTESTVSEQTTAAVPTPPAVDGLMVASIGAGQVRLAWTASSSAGVTGYKIRQTVDATETEIDVSGMAAASHTVTGLTNGKSHSFTIAAVAGSTESTQSTAVTAIPGVPQNVRAAVSEDAAGTAGSRQQVVLSWTEVVGAASYKVYQDSTALAATITGATHTLSGLTDGQSYSFTVSFVNSSNQESAQSAAVATCSFTDADGDGMIEICTLDHLARINTDATTRGDDYELVRNLDFSSQYSYAPSSTNWTNKTWRPVNTSTAAASSTVVAHGSAVNTGWIPIGHNGSRSIYGQFQRQGLPH